MKNLLVLFAFLICSFNSNAQTTGSFDLIIDFEETDYDFTRKLYYFVPSDYDASQSYKLVVGFRGGPHANAGQFRDQLTFLADSIGAIILCPENEDHFWNDEGLTKQLFQYSLDTTMAMYNIDSDFVYLTGLSYGGRHAVIVSMDTDDGLIPGLRGVIPFAAGSEADDQPNYDSIDDFPPACICIGLNDSQNFITVSNNLATDITDNGGAAFLNEVPNVGHTVAFANYPEEMMECFDFIESQYGVSSTIALNVADKSIRVFPNPATSVLTFEIDKTIQAKRVYLTDMNGKLIKEFEATKRELNVSDLPQGVLLLIIETEKEQLTKQVTIVK
ncbi:MAG: T9SS type A sorting domain-containing protein [Saprospiraceae bacterium]